jgi:hypothetical protein
MEYIKWTADKLEDYLKDKERERGIDIQELLHLSAFVRKHKFESMFDLGTFLGISGYIIGTASPNTKTLISSDIGKFEMELGKKHKWDYDTYGMYLPKEAIYIEGDYRKVMDGILEKYKPEFVFLDDGHKPRWVFEQISLCYKHKVPYVAIHDTGHKVRKVRHAMKGAISNNMYKIIFEDIDTCPEKGISFLERI